MLMTLINGKLSTEQIIISMFAYLMVLFLIQPLHECAHALVAHLMGDDTAKEEGRMTVNPIKHLDPAGTVAMLIFGFGWGKPVPIDPQRFRNIRAGIGLSAFAGPLSNFIAAFFGMVGAKLSQGTELSTNDKFYGYLLIFFILFTQLNIGLCVFNLIPVSPLDGDKVLFSILPKKASMKYIELTRRYSQFMPMLLFALMFTPALDFVREKAFNLLDTMTFFLDSYAMGTAG